MNCVCAGLKMAKQTNLLMAVLKKENLVAFFKSYTPPLKNGYAFDENIHIKKIRKLCKEHEHCLSSFSVCCNRVKKMLNQE